MKPDTVMMSYQNTLSIDEDDDIAIPLIITILRPTMTTTMECRSSKKMIAVVAGMMMLVLVAVGAVLLHKTNDAGLTSTAAGGLVVTKLQENNPCLAAPMDATFGGTSVTTTHGFVGRGPS